MSKPTFELTPMDSPFAEFINTNWTPSDSERRIIEAVIKERQNVVQSMNEEIQKIEAPLNTLKEDRGVHLKYIQHYKPFLSPVKRLPIDILSTIFLACQSPINKFGGPFTSNMTKDNPAVIISHVCRQWRRISFDTPLLWANIHISPLPCPSPNPRTLPIYAIPHNHMDAHARHIEKWESTIARTRDILKIWIARSGGCSLTLRFNAQDIAGTTGPRNGPGNDDPTIPIVQKYLADFVDILRHTSMRWRAIDFAFIITSSATSLLRLLLFSPDQLPLLEVANFLIHFQMDADDQLLEDRKQALIPNMGAFKSPLLRSLTMPALWRGIATIPVRWSSLTELNFSGYNLYFPRGGTYLDAPSPFGAEEARALLKACPRLVHCTLGLQGRANDDTPFHGLLAKPLPIVVTEQISLPFLQKLTMRGPVPNGFASSLILPSLHTIDICSAPTPLNEHESGLVDFIRCFGSQLTTVSFSYFALTPSALTYCLENIPNVTDLHLLSRLGEHRFVRPSKPPSLMTPDVLARLTPQFFDDDSSGYDLLEPCFCPKLRHFRCRLSEAEFTEHDLVNFIAARRSPRTFTDPDSGSGSSIARIKRVGVEFGGYQGMDIEDELIKQNIDTDGFVLKVIYPPEPAPYPVRFSLDLEDL